MDSKKLTHWDTQKSFYKWHIYLANGKHFPGYSKKIEGTEPKDKCKLLFRILRRLRKEQDKRPNYKYGYFTPGLVDCIEFYKRTGLGEYEEKLMTLYPLYYTHGENSDFNSKPEIQNFLNDFYSEITSGKIIPSDAKKDQLYMGIGYSKRIDESKYFDLAPYRFKAVRDLDAFISKALSDGYGFEVLHHFRNQYIEKNLLKG